MNEAHQTRRPGRGRRRLLVTGCAFVALVAASTLVWWFLWVPHWRPALHDGEQYGIDVSSHQGSIDWRRVASDHIAFAYVKATEGGDFIDERFAENWSGAEAAGIERGAYHFFTLCTPAAVQAANFLSVAPPTENALGPAIDLELAGNCRERPDAETVAAEVDEFLRTVEARWGRSVVLYVGDDFEARYPTRDRGARPLWYRRVLRRPGFDNWSIWQAQGRAHVDGINGQVDLNVRRAG